MANHGLGEVSVEAEGAETRVGAMRALEDACVRTPLLVLLAVGLLMALTGGALLLLGAGLVLGGWSAFRRDPVRRAALRWMLLPLILLPLLWWPAQGLTGPRVQEVVPEPARLVVLEVLEGGRPVPDGQRVLVSVVRWEEERGTVIADRVQATLPENVGALRTGSRWLAFGRVAGPSRALHDWAFDPKRFALDRGIQGRFHLEGDALILLEDASGWRAGLDARRQALEASIVARHDPEVAGILMAMLTGSRGHLDREIRQRFAAQGVAHVLAVSGLHMALVLLLAWRLLTSILSALPERCGLVPPRVAAAMMLPWVPVYVLLTGASASARRAGIMVSVLLLAAMWARPVSAIRALSLAFVVWVLVEPGLASDLGFQLSVSATAGLILLGSGLPVAREAPLGTGWRQRLLAAGRRVVQALVAGQVAAMATLVPLLAVFGEAPSLSPFANLVVVPPLTLVAMPAALAATVLEVVFPALADPLWWISSRAVRVALLLSVWVDPMLGRAWVWGHPSVSGLVGWSGCALATILAGRWILSGPLGGRRRDRMARLAGRGSLLVGAVSCVLVLCDLPPAWTAPKGVRVYAIPVGHGDASLIELPCGVRILLDAGGRGFDGGGVGRAAVLSFLRGRGIHRVDVFISSHGHADHAGGLVELMPLLRPREIWVGATDLENNRMDQALRAAADRHGVRWVEVDGEASRLVRGSTIIDILPRMPEAPSINDASLVLRLCFEGTCMLFPGDAERPREAALVEDPGTRALLRAQALKVGHHGSRTSTTEAWLDAVQPGVAVLHVGRRFGHPHDEVVLRFAARRIPLYRTDRREVYALELQRDQIVTFMIRRRVLRA